jgi:hypothetical protein
MPVLSSAVAPQKLLDLFEFIDYSISLTELSHHCSNEFPVIYRRHDVQFIANGWQRGVSHGRLLRVPRLLQKKIKCAFMTHIQHFPLIEWVILDAIFSIYCQIWLQWLYTWLVTIRKIKSN